MNNDKILKRLNSLELAAQLILEECHKTKELLGGVYPSTARKGSSKFTEEDAARLRLNHRRRALGKELM